MDKRINTGSGCCDYNTAVAAAPATATKLFVQRINNTKHTKQQTKIAAGGNSSPRLAATFQGMSVNTLPPQSASSGVHSWPSAPRHTNEQQAASTTQETTSTTYSSIPSRINNKQQPHNNNNNNHNGSANNVTKVQKQQQPALPAAEQYATAIRTKPRNKSEEAINDLLQRIPDIGQIFDVQSRIGNGTFSTVLLATLKREAQLPESMRRKFAIKHHIPTSHPDRIMKELQCMTDMGGTNNVVGIHCCLRCEASAAFVMPYMPHDRFHDFYTKMDVPEIRMYMRNLLLALRHVHKFNVIHRDVKPSNFLYNRRQGQFLLVDFGLAQHVNVAQQQQHQQQQQQLAYRCGANSKRPRERDITVNQQQQQHLQQQQQHQQQQQQLTPSEAALGGAVKRMRLIDEPALMMTTTNWNKMPLKPVNEIAQSAKQLNINETGDASATAHTAHIQSQSQSPVMVTQSEQGAASSTKYNTNRTAGGGGGGGGAGSVGGGGNSSKCFCFANPTVCLNCLMKKEVHASRAGTPGYRPPEVLLKYADQTTSVDVWAAGVIFLSILSSVYPFFKAPNDFVALAEIVTIFGDRAIRKTALALERMVTLSQRSKPLNLRKLCLRFRNRLIFSDQRMVRKHESPDGRIDVCKNCDQYFFNCLCEESEYVTEPLDPYECFPASAYDLLGRLLEINPHRRITAEEALNHPFFTEEQTNAPIAPIATAAVAGAAGVAAASVAKVRHNGETHNKTQTTRRRATKAAGAGASVGAAEQLHPALNKL